MKKHLRTQILLALTPFLFIACSKGGDDGPAPKTKTELLTQTSWTFDNAKVGGFDVSGFLQTCQKDNVGTFVSNGTGTMDEGASRCSGTDPQSVPFTWNFETSETILHVSIVFFTGGSSNFNIITLNESQLVVSQDVTVSGSTQNAVITFKH